MNKYKATNEQIKQIKAAIKEHGIRGLTWQSVASRPDKIDEFLNAANHLKDTYARVMGANK